MALPCRADGVLQAGLSVLHVVLIDPPEEAAGLQVVVQADQAYTVPAAQDTADQAAQAMADQDEVDSLADQADQDEVDSMEDRTMVDLVMEGRHAGDFHYFTADIVAAVDSAAPPVWQPCSLRLLY